MSQIHSKIVGIVLAGFLAGCGGDVEQTSEGFRPTDTKPLDPMVKEMQNMMKKGDYAKRAEPPPEKKAKDADKKKK